MRTSDSHKTNATMWMQPESLFTNDDLNAVELRDSPVHTGLRLSGSDGTPCADGAHTYITREYGIQGGSVRNSTSNTPVQASPMQSFFLAAPPETSVNMPLADVMISSSWTSTSPPTSPATRRSGQAVTAGSEPVSYSQTSMNFPSAGTPPFTPATGLRPVGTAAKKPQDTTEQRIEKMLLQQRNIYLSGLPPEFRPAELRSLCELFGPVESVKLCMIDSASLQGEAAQRAAAAAASGPNGSRPSLSSQASLGTARTDANRSSGNGELGTDESDPVDDAPRRHEIVPACKGYGFVLFHEAESASACITALNNTVMRGKPLQVRRADLTAAPPRKNPGLPPLLATGTEQGLSFVNTTATPAWAPSFSNQTTPHMATPSYGFTSAMPGLMFHPGAPVSATTAPGAFSVQPTPPSMPTATDAMLAPLHYASFQPLPGPALAPPMTSAVNSTMLSGMPTHRVADNGPVGAPFQPPSPFLTAATRTVPTGAPPLALATESYMNPPDYRIMYVAPPPPPGMQTFLAPQSVQGMSPFGMPAPAAAGPGSGPLLYYFVGPDGQAYAMPSN